MKAKQAILTLIMLAVLIGLPLVPQYGIAADSKERIVIDKALHVLVHYDENGSAQHCFPISCGTFSTPSEEGRFRVYFKRINPRWFLERWLEDNPEALPYKPYVVNPANPLGTRFMGFNGDYGIHGTNEPMLIGRHVSHGCIRMQITNVEELFPTVERGTPVELRSDPAIPWRLTNSFSSTWGIHNILNLARRTRAEKGEIR